MYFKYYHKNLKYTLFLSFKKGHLVFYVSKSNVTNKNNIFMKLNLKLKSIGIVGFPPDQFTNPILYISLC